MSNAYEVLWNHHKVLKSLGARLKAAPVGSAERDEIIDELLLELDIHMRIEDDIYYPAVAELTTLVAIAHAEHRQVRDQLAVALRTPVTAPNYQDEWVSFLTVLDAHADEEERDMIPPPAPAKFSEAELDRLGDAMTAQMERLRNSRSARLHVKRRTALLRAL